MKAIEVGLKNPYLVVVGVLLTVVVGVVSMTRIPADLLPVFKTPAVQIVCFYPGMPPVVMERDIMSRLQRWTGQSVGIEHQEAKAMQGVCIVKDFFREDISFDTAMSQVTSYAMSDMFYLPPGTIPPMVMPFDPTASVPLCLVSVSSPTMTEKELYDVAYYELRNRLQSIQGVIAPAVYGGKLRRILAYVDPLELEARGLSPMDIVDSLGEQSVFIPTGNAKFGDIDYQIVSNAMPEKVEELNDIPIKTDKDAVVFMRDVGEVKDSSQIQTNIVRINGRRQVYIPIYRQPGANTIEIVDAIKSKLQNIWERLRSMDTSGKEFDLALEVVMDQSDYVRNSITSLHVAGVLGAVLAGGCVFVFLRNWRSTLIIILAIPLSILAALIGLFSTGDTINSMTLGGLVLAIGILVDQSIVVLDNITRHLEMGKTRMQAAIDGTTEVALPVLVSTLTFAVVFFPVIFLTGIARFLFQPLAITVVFAVFASYIVAMFVIPALCARFLNKSPGASTGTGQFGKAAPPWFEIWFGVIMRRKRQVILLSGGLLILSVFLLTRTGTELFPQVDSNQFTIYVRQPSGTRIENTEAAIKEIEQVLIEEIGQPDPQYPATENHEDSNMRILISNVGVLMDWPAAYTPNVGAMDAFVLVQLKGKGGLPGTFDYVASLRKKLNERFPGVEFAFDTGGMMTAALNFGLPSPINIRVQGSDLLTSEEISHQIRRAASNVPGAADVRVAQRMDYPQIDVQVDRVKAAQLGISQENIIKNIVTAVNSSIGFNPAFWIAPNGNHYFIGAQYAEEGIDSVETLRNIPITGANSQQPVPLRNVATLTRTTGPAVVNHVNITRTIDVFANVEAGYDVGTVAGNIEAAIQETANLRANAKETNRGVEYDLLGREADLAGEILSIQRSEDDGISGLKIRVAASSTGSSGEVSVPVDASTRIDSKQVKELAAGVHVAIWNGVGEGTVSADQVTKLDKPVNTAEDLPGFYEGRGYSYSVGGEVHSMRESFSAFAEGLVIAIILVYLAMVAQLRSFSTPLIIMLSIPLGFIGVGLALYLTGTNLSIPAFMGIIMMTGIVVEYSIILLEFANRRVREGKSVAEAIKEATWIRMRPILMTSLTTWLALLPMAIGAAGGEANAPLARTIIGGVLAATLLSLVVVPCLYVMFKREVGHSPEAAVVGV